MPMRLTVAILSDIHYAGPAEQAQSDYYEFHHLKNPFVRWPIRTGRHIIWLRDPLRQNHLLDRFIELAGSPDFVVANGDYSCNTAYAGLSDDAAFQSTSECLQILRKKYAPKFQATIGDHELGKLSFYDARGGLRLTSLRRAEKDLGLQTVWQVELGNYTLLGVTSTLIALPVYEADAPSDERAGWRQRREQHLEEIRRAFSALKPDRRVILFCHDPTALPFLWHDETIRGRLAQIESTIIGHLHSALVFRMARLAAGMPAIGFMGHSVKRMTTALSESRHWRPFHVRFCPSLAGIELLKDGGFLTVSLDPMARSPAEFQLHRLKR